MSWDVSIYRFASESPPQPDHEGEYNGQALGEFDSLRATLSSTLPIRWEDSGWGVLSSPDFTIEFNMAPDRGIGSIPIL